MLLELLRFSTTPEATLGALYIDGTFECFGIEDTWHPNKIPAETRIHPGLYDVGVRATGGSFNPIYSERYPFHAGMLQLQDVPEFTYVYIHTGNNAGHTEGCILVNTSAESHPFPVGGSSRKAYSLFYPKVIEEALAGELKIRIRDYA